MRSFLHSPKSFLLLSLALPLLLSSSAWGKAELAPHTVLQTHHSPSGLVRNSIDDVKEATTFERAPEDLTAEGPALADKRGVYRDTFGEKTRTRGAGEEDLEDLDPVTTKWEAAREHGLVGTVDPLGDDINLWRDQV